MRPELSGSAASLPSPRGRRCPQDGRGERDLANQGLPNGSSRFSVEWLRAAGWWTNLRSSPEWIQWNIWASMLRGIEGPVFK